MHVSVRLYFPATLNSLCSPLDVSSAPDESCAPLERANRTLSRQHSQQSQSLSSLTSDLWDGSSTNTPGSPAGVIHLLSSLIQN